MEPSTAIRSFGALAHRNRLDIFRLLIQAGPNGLSAGKIAEKVGLAASTLSFHLSQLEGAGLLRSWRVHRHIYYAVEIDAVRQLLVFLTEDCCNGHPEICGNLTRLDALDPERPQEAGNDGTPM